MPLTDADINPGQYNNLQHTEMKRIRQSQMALQICRRIAAMLFAFAAVLPPLAARAEKANVFFIHGANVNEQDARAWAAEMFKRLWQDDQTP